MPKVKKSRTTVFSIDSKTGEPHLTVEYAKNLIMHHVHTRASYLLYRYEMEDIVQEVLLKFVKVHYKPKLVAPRTFAIMVIKQAIARILVYASTQKNSAATVVDNKGQKVYTKSGNAVTVPAKVIGERLEISDEGEMISSLDFRPDMVTPEDVLLAKERVEEHEELMKVNAAENRVTKTAPKDYAGFRPMRPSKQRPKYMGCRGTCGETKPFDPEYFARNKLRKWGLNIVCLVCSRAAKNAWYAKLPKDQKR
jgi:DNA-directed RNA polymerase specialized sigma24 family protein